MKKIACDKNYRMLRLAKEKQPWKVAPSDIHGNGIIAIKKIPKGGSLTFTAIDVINETNGKKLRLETGIVLKLI